MKRGGTAIKTVWITGASSGLGLATARAFAGRGWLVVAGARSFADAPAAQEDAEHWVRLRLDVTDEESCARFAKRALEISPRVDALVCGAAVLVLGSCEKTGADEYSRVLDTNFTGAARMVRLALPHMRAQGGGRIVMFSSINGLLGIPFQSAYTASKHALEGYAECLAMEAAPWGVQVCLVEPGDHRGGSQRTRLNAREEDGTSPYHSRYEAAVAVIHRDEAGGLSPDRLGEKLVRNVERRHMRFRLRVAKPDQHLAVWLHALLPPWLNGRILSAYYGGDKQGASRSA